MPVVPPCGPTDEISVPGVMEMEMRYCDTCRCERPSHIEEREETYKVRGEEVTFRGPLRVCDVCGCVVGDEELDNAMLVSMYNEYRRRHGMLMPDEIRAIRQKYNLSKIAAAKLLGWSPTTFSRYESGALQDMAHEFVLRAMEDPSFVRNLLQKNANKLSALQRRRVEEAIGKIDWTWTDLDRIEEEIGRVCSEYGFDFQPRKLCRVVSSVGERFGVLPEDVFWSWIYAFDALSNEYYEHPITGLVYVAGPSGPVPLRKEMVMDYLLRAGAVELRDGVLGVQTRLEEPLESWEGFVEEYLFSTFESPKEIVGTVRKVMSCEHSNDVIPFRGDILFSR